MTAELLRRASSQMRERAEGVAATEWFCTTADQERFDGYDVWTHDGETHWTVATSDYAPTAEFIAGMSPVVALAVADLLENEANAWDAVDKYDLPAYNSGRARLLTDLARAYLGVSV